MKVYYPVSVFPLRETSLHVFKEEEPITADNATDMLRIVVEVLAIADGVSVLDNSGALVYCNPD